MATIPILDRPLEVFLCILSKQFMDELSLTSFKTTAGKGHKPRSDARTSKGSLSSGWFGGNSVLC